MVHLLWRYSEDCEFSGKKPFTKGAYVLKRLFSDPLAAKLVRHEVHLLVLRLPPSPNRHSLQNLHFLSSDGTEHVPEDPRIRRDPERRQNLRKRRQNGVTERVAGGLVATDCGNRSAAYQTSKSFVCWERSQFFWISRWTNRCTIKENSPRLTKPSTSCAITGWLTRRQWSRIKSTGCSRRLSIFWPCSRWRSQGERIWRMRQGN